MTDLDELERLARAATRGPWRHYHDKLRPQFSTVIDEVQTEDGRAVVAWGGFDAADYIKVQNGRNAAYIAACDPSTILELIAMARGESITEAVQAERRACAEIARHYDDPHCFDPEMSVARSTKDAIASAIEARKD